MCSEPTPIRQISANPGRTSRIFHANDKNHERPRLRRMDFKPIAAALKEVGYEGYVSVEVFKFEEGPEVIAGKSH